MSFDVLSDDEFAVVEAVREGRAKHFQGPAKPVLNGELIRRLALHMDLPPRKSDGRDVGSVTARGARIHISGARIEGRIDLDGLGNVDGQGALALVLEDCELVGDGAPAIDSDGLPAPSLSAADARLSRLCLRNSRFARLDIGRAQIVGEVDLSGVGPLSGEEDAPCWVRARGVTLGGSFIADGAKLRVKARAARDPDKASNQALEMSEAVIRGSFQFDFSDAIGGVTIRNSRIDGDFWMIGAKIVAGEGQAIAARGVRIGGALAMRPADASSPTEPNRPFDCTGLIELNFAEVGGFTQISPGGAPPAGEENARRGGEAITAWCAKFGWLALEGKILGPVSFGRAHIANSVTINAEILTLGYAASFDGAHIGSSLTIEEKATLTGQVSLSYAEIGGDFIFRGVIDPGQDALAITATPIHVKGKAVLAGKIAGVVNFDGARIDGELLFGELPDRTLTFAAKRFPGRTAAPHELKLQDATIARALRFDRRIIFEPMPALERAQGALMRVARARAIPLSFYPGWLLVEAQFADERGRAQGFLVKQGDADAAAVTLYGASAPIHDFNAKHGITLQNEEQAKQFLLFFCTYVWGDEGPFTILEKRSDLPERSPLRRKVRDSDLRISITRDGDAFLAGAYVYYGAAVFKAQFRILNTGMIEMVDDEPVGEVGGAARVAHEAPYRMPASKQFGGWGGLRPPFGREDDYRSWRKASNSEKTAIERALFGPAGPPKRGARGKNRSDVARERPIIDLSGAHIGLLSDKRGIAWPTEALLVLEGLSYERLWEAARSREGISSVAGEFPGRDRSSRQAEQPAAKTPPVSKSAPQPLAGGSDAARPRDNDQRGAGANRWEDRKSWLLRQYPDQAEPRMRGDYNPQPYESLIAALHAMGDSEAARQIARWKLRIESKLIEPTPISRARKLVIAPLNWLNMVCFGRGLSWSRALVTVLVLWVAGWAGACIAERDWPSRDVAGVRVVPASSAALVMLEDGAPTGAACTVIDPAWYALDTFIPLVDLRQEARCDIHPRRTAWVAAKSAYALLGWLVTSLALLTMSGLLRRYAERG